MVEGRADCHGIVKMKDIALKNAKNIPGERVVNKLQDFVWDEILSEHCQLPQVINQLCINRAIIMQIFMKD